MVPLTYQTFVGFSNPHFLAPESYHGERDYPINFQHLAKVFASNIRSNCMKNRSYFLLAFIPAFALSAGSIFAEGKKGKSFLFADGQKAHVLQMDPDFPAEQLEREGVKVHTLKNVQESQEVLPVYLQSRFLREAKLDSYVLDWSGFEKDRLCLRAEHQNPDEVVARYDGKLPLESITKLKQLIAQHRAGKK
jgi:hypothetical protein